jgi:molybdopterin-guanine dinucleotide biosynthesis protein A
LRLPGGETLLDRQIWCLREAGARRVLVSTQRGRDYRGADGLVYDSAENEGPLAGIAAGLRAAGEGLVLALAVDMPRVDPGHFRGLLRQIDDAPALGIVPVCDGIIEPLMAVYPAALSASAEARLKAGQDSPRDWVKQEAATGRLRLWPAPASWHTAARSWNTPDDPDFALEL